MKPTTLLSLALLSVGANANVFTIDPVAATIWNGGDKVKISWKDDNSSPKLKELNSLTLELMTGTDTDQTSLDVIAKNVKGTTGTVNYTVPKVLGPPGKFYFIRFNQGTNFVWSTRFDIQKITGKALAPPPSNPTTTDSKVAAPPAAAPTVPAAAPKVETPKAETPKAEVPKASDASKSTPPAAASASASTTPTPSSASSEAIGVLPSSLMSMAIGGIAFIFTYLY